MNKKRKISFYRLILEKYNVSEDGNTVTPEKLSLAETENKFDYLCDAKSVSLSNGNKAFYVSGAYSDYVIEIIEKNNHCAFVKIGQQNPSNLVALRDSITLETENVPMTENQLLELFTFALIDFKTNIISYIGINGAPKITAIKLLFNNNLIKEEQIHTELSAIVTNDVIKVLSKKNKITKLSVSVEIPSDKILSDKLGVNEHLFDEINNIRTSRMKIDLLARRNKNIFKNNSSIGVWLSNLQQKYGDKIISLKANAKNEDENSQEYDLLESYFTKTVIIGEADSNILLEEDFKNTLINTYNSNKSDLLLYCRD